MKKVQIKASKRNGKIIKAHTRVVKGGNAGSGMLAGRNKPKGGDDYDSIKASAAREKELKPIRRHRQS